MAFVRIKRIRSSRNEFMGTERYSVVSVGDRKHGWDGLMG
jgi:hypothetical protein